LEEKLAEYLQRILRQRDLKPADVKELSGLSESYIGRLLKGQKTNLTVETIGILANALEVDPFELFAAAFGRSPESVKAGIDPLLLADTIQKLLLNPKLIELVQSVDRIKSPKHQKTIFETVRVLGLPKSQKSRKRDKK
jgi:transcriptional regulator with XRE-family HTH domain